MQASTISIDWYNNKIKLTKVPVYAKTGTYWPVPLI